MLTFYKFILFTTLFNAFFVVLFFLILKPTFERYFPKSKYRDGILGLAALLIGCAGAAYLLLKFFNYLV